MMDVDGERLSFQVMFIVLFFLIPWLVVKTSYDARYKFDISDLWTYHERIDLFRVMVLVAWWAHTSSNILWTLAQQITTADWAAYAGIWIAPVIVRMVGAAFGNGHSTQKEPS